MYRFTDKIVDPGGLVIDRLRGDTQMEAIQEELPEERLQIIFVTEIVHYWPSEDVQENKGTVLAYEHTHDRELCISSLYLCQGSRQRVPDGCQAALSLLQTP